jgi:hypothetical protein
MPGMGAGSVCSCRSVRVSRSWRSAVVNLHWNGPGGAVVPCHPHRARPCRTYRSIPRGSVGKSGFITTDGRCGRGKGSQGLEVGARAGAETRCVRLEVSLSGRAPTRDRRHLLTADRVARDLRIAALATKAVPCHCVPPVSASVAPHGWRFQPDPRWWIEHVEIDWTVGGEREATGQVVKLGDVGMSA